MILLIYGNVYRRKEKACVRKQISDSNFDSAKKKIERYIIYHVSFSVGLIKFIFVVCAIENYRE